MYVCLYVCMYGFQVCSKVMLWFQIPSCWLTADHQAVVWCWQLVMATVRALFDAVDNTTLQLTKNRTLIVDVFDYHLSKVQIFSFIHVFLANYILLVLFIFLSYNINK